MKINKMHEDGRVVLLMRGDFESFAAGPFARYVHGLMDDGVKDLELDLQRVKFMSSRAVGEILRVKRAMEARGGVLRIERLSEVARWTLTTLKAEKLLYARRMAA